MVVCTLTDIVSWFSCAQTGAPFAELITIVVFSVAFLALKTSSTREALTASLFIATFTAATFTGMGVIGITLPLVGIILTGLSAVFLNSQNST